MFGTVCTQLEKSLTLQRVAVEEQHLQCRQLGQFRRD